MKKTPLIPKGLLITMIVVAVFVGIAGLSFIGAMFADDDIGRSSVAVVSYYGAIADSQSEGFLRGGTTPQDFIQQMNNSGKNATVKAVVVRINSPGGSPAASQEMYQAIRRVRAKKPVYCSMGDVAASGGYYTAAACDKIYADPATLTGSIGVISEFMNFQELMQKLGVQSEVMTTGKFKDSGSPFRGMRPDEKELFNELLHNLYNQFVNDVVEGRREATGGKLTREKVLLLATGRVYTGEQAQKNLLVDELGGLHDAVEAAAKKGGIEGEPNVIDMGRGSGISSIFSSSFSDTISAASNQMGQALAQGLAEGLRQQTVQQNATSAGNVRF